MAWSRARRYRDVGVAPGPAGFAVTIDGKPLLTPSGAPLAVPTAALAAAISEEWAAQTAEVRPESVVLTRLANGVVDHVRSSPSAAVDRLMGYAATDLLCYRAAAPPDLAARQAQAWQPILDWLAEALGARLAVTAGIVAIAQPADALRAIRGHLAAATEWELGGLSALVQATGSLALGLAVGAGRLAGEEAWRLSNLEEAFQSERWGEDEAAAARRRKIRDDIAAAERFLALCRA